MPLTQDQIRDRLRLYAAEFAQLCGQVQVTKTDLLTGTATHHGLNHLTETWMMLSEGPNKAEFPIRE